MFVKKISDIIDFKLLFSLWIMFFVAIGFLALTLLIIITIFRSFSNRNSQEAALESVDVPNDSISEYIDDAVYSKKLLMDYEQDYYYKIHAMLPDNVLLHTQVSFSAFLTSSEVRTRNKYNRNHVDMLISDLDFNVLLILEIDGSSHRSSRVKQRDKKRDAITSSAGIPTLRIDYSVSDRQIAEAINYYIPLRIEEIKKSA